MPAPFPKSSFKYTLANSSVRQYRNDTLYKVSSANRHSEEPTLWNCTTISSWKVHFVDKSFTCYWGHGWRSWVQGQGQQLKITHKSLKVIMNGFKELMKKSLSLAYVVSFTSAEHIFNHTRYLPLTCELGTQLLGYHLWHVSILIAKLI